MQTLVPAARVTFDAARDLADVYGTILDLRFAREVVKRLAAMQNDPDPVVLRALWNSALIAYARCFSSGKRRSDLRPDIFLPVDGALAVHEYFINMRNKHVAHSVNPFEQLAVDIQLVPEGDGPKEIQGVGISSMVHVGPGSGDAQNFLNLIDIAIPDLEHRQEELREAVLQKARSLPINELYQAARNRLIVPPGSSAGTPR
jgi:hypothetical protein